MKRKTRFLLALALMSVFILVVGIIGIPSATAFPNYDWNGQGCVQCHPGFQGGFAGELHGEHLTFTSTCLLCHTEVGDDPSTKSSGDPNGQGCRGCHGVDNGTESAWTAGLRLHHANSGITVCATCHPDDPTPDPENVMPVYYSRDDVNVNDPCGDDLDNDGDLLYDADDPDCQAAQPTETPTEVPPTETPTEVPPTETPTEVPPTETPTEVPPTETPTEVPPTETPTEVPPTETPTEVPPTATPTPTTPAAIPSGTDTLTARVYIDYRCDGFFQSALDVPIGDVSVTLGFPDGSSETRQTRPFGLVNFAGFDASGGVTVSVTLPRGYKGYSLDSCPNSPTTIELEPNDFPFRYKVVQFRAEVVGEEASP